MKDAVEVCMLKGLMVKSSSDNSSHDYVHAPISLFPTPFPNNLYKEAIDFQIPLGVMISDLIR